MSLIEDKNNQGKIQEVYYEIIPPHIGRGNLCDNSLQPDSSLFQDWIVRVNYTSDFHFNMQIIKWMRKVSQKVKLKNNA